ncbi:MAG TPA: hypothetical protein PKN75_09430 [Bacteroidia bacterium]|nr:hypothetical protein [Bacteroidia bacterium]HNU33803.1 hypothetical protein [Bacteroidia bacterium]
MCEISTAVCSNYVSSGIGLKFVNWTFEPLSGNYNTPPEIASLILTKPIEEKLLVIPISLRYGARGSIEGGFGEYFFGVSFNFGAGNLPESKELKNLFDERPMRDLAFNIGYLWGIGWAD